MFRPEEIWHGGYFELSIELGERCDDRVRSAIDAVWRHPNLKGCYEHRDIEPENQKQISPSSFNYDDGRGGHSLGVASLSSDQQIACGTCVIRETNGPDWLNLYLPMGALGTALEVGGYPFLLDDDPPPTWLIAVEQWLADIAASIAEITHFRLALIGFEVSGSCYASDIERDGIPDTRYIGYVWPTDGRFEYFKTNAEFRAKQDDA